MDEAVVLPTLILEDAVGFEGLRVAPYVEDIVDSGYDAIHENEGARASDDESSYKHDPISDGFYTPINTSMGVVIEDFNVPDIIDKVADADNKLADIPILSDTIKLFDIVAMVKTEHLVSPRVTAYAMCPVSYFHHFAARAKVVEDSKSRLLLWFSIISPVQKHEWEPPP
ncbi:unnamed protein product [Cuscuta campestris]|uniref:Uncharacterized protein n=1 Tax=Cuscuta campestris TaxID=132261 RepID=A0A484NCX2_9ASTE|nr:unnamed protein product [Cuscuta campestris]